MSSNQLALIRHIIAVFSVLAQQLVKADNDSKTLYLSDNERTSVLQSLVPQVNNLLLNAVSLTNEDIAAILNAAVYLESPACLYAVMQLNVDPEYADLRLQALCACTGYITDLTNLQEEIKIVYPDTQFTETKMISTKGNAVIPNYLATLKRIKIIMHQLH